MKDYRSLPKIKYIILLALFICLMVVFQLISGIIKLGPLSLSFVLVPISLGAQLIGKKFSTLLGFAFGVITIVGCITGSDPGGSILFNANPLVTILLCLVKATLAGFLSGLLYEILLKVSNVPAASITSAAICPIANTAIFLLFMIFFFYDVLLSWSGGKPIINYIIIDLVGLNFITEFILNIIIVPIINKTLFSSNKFLRFFNK